MEIVLLKGLGCLRNRDGQNGDVVPEVIFSAPGNDSFDQRLHSAVQAEGSGLCDGAEQPVIAECLLLGVDFLGQAIGIQIPGCNSITDSS
jgi:hypothetical protein